MLSAAASILNLTAVSIERSVSLIGLQKSQEYYLDEYHAYEFDKVPNDTHTSDN